MPQQYIWSTNSASKFSTYFTNVDVSRKLLEFNRSCSVRNKQLPTCPTQVKFAGGKLIDWEGSPLDKLKFINN